MPNESSLMIDDRHLIQKISKYLSGIRGDCAKSYWPNSSDWTFIVFVNLRYYFVHLRKKRESYIGLSSWVLSTRPSSIIQVTCFGIISAYKLIIIFLVKVLWRVSSYFQ